MTSPSDVKRKQNESPIDYKYRICRDRELLGIETWYDVANLLNKEFEANWTESTYRKWFTNFQSGVEYSKSQLSNNEYLQEIEDKTLELEKKTWQFRDQKRERTNAVRAQARFEHLKNEIDKSIASLKNEKPLNFQTPPFPSIVNKGKKAVLLVSDWHYGADFSNSLNTYNPSVFRSRVEQLTTKALTYAERNNVTDLVLANLGDQVNGLIHVSSRVQASEDVIRQTQVVSEVLAEMTAKFSGIFNTVKVINICGNHARTIGNKTESVMKENFEKLVPWYLESRLKDFKNVEILIDADGYYIDEVEGEKFVYVHGDLDYVSSAAKTLPQMLGIIPKFLFSGHIHHNHVKEHGRTTHIVSGSLMGVDDYAISKRFYAEPMQKFLILDGSNIECSYDIKVK
ncbi:hypothetical protein BC351_00390 [Paenibacillus ferrarius]|uniref:Calcineurin-like phosphoesterase domain-containing protein n=1 Tax=Paenibacillus ferrarius TaxID=1469647 RepID=A0A1V4HS17_9BACL|nr:metallophosphoesterase family protein [Paenibacillus ferrarius]OPH61734.1 hypothetical protein BC351_00390 [Paenibacillus ferrarius]